MKGILTRTIMITALLTTTGALAQSLEWYKSHDAERSAKVDECKKASDPRETEDCRNAIDASVHGGTYTKSPEKSW